MILTYKLMHEAAKPPFRKHDTDAGFDLCIVDSAVIYPARTEKLSTGLAFAVPKGYFGDIRARSSTTLRGLSIAGVVDSEYRGVVYLLVTNNGLDVVEIKPGERIAQLVCLPVAQLEAVPVDELDDTARGSDGFGSTGK